MLVKARKKVEPYVPHVRVLEAKEVSIEEYMEIVRKFRKYVNSEKTDKVDVEALEYLRKCTIMLDRMVKCLS